jgi:hypothetical protein
MKTKYVCKNEIEKGHLRSLKSKGKIETLSFNVYVLR